MQLTQWFLQHRWEIGAPNCVERKNLFQAHQTSIPLLAEQVCMHPAFFKYAQTLAHLELLHDLSKSENIPTNQQDTGANCSLHSCQRPKTKDAICSPWLQILGPALHSLEPVDNNFLSELGSMFPLSGIDSELGEALAYLSIHMSC